MNIHRACELGDLERVKYLVEGQGVSVNGLVSRYKYTPLMCATTHYGNLHIVRYLLDKGASVNAVDKDGWSALHHSCYTEEGDKGDIFKLLVERGANVYAITSAGSTMLHVAARGGYVSIVQYLLEHTTLDVNIIRYGDITALSESDNIHIVELLLRHGANPTRGRPRSQHNPLVLHAQKTYRIRVCVLIFMSAKRIPRLGAQSTIRLLPTDLIRKLLTFFV